MNKLANYIKQIRGVSYKPTDLLTETDIDAIPILRANNIRNGSINFEELVYVKSKRVSQEQYLRKGDILICASSGSKELVGKAAYVKKDLNMAFGAFCKVIRPIDCNYSEYLGHFFQSGKYRKIISGSAQGANINNLRSEHIDDLEFEIPEQILMKKAVNQLDRVAHLLSLRHQQLEKLDLLVKSRFVEMFGDVVKNDKNWNIVPLEQVAEIKIGPFGTLLHKEDYILNGHPLVNPSHIIEGKIVTDNKLTIDDKKYDELKAYNMQIGDIVLGRRGEMGRCAVVEKEGLLCGTGSMMLRPNNKMKPFFLQTIISNPAYKKIMEDKAVGITMQNLNVPIVSKLPIPLLPTDLQERFILLLHQVDKSKFVIKQSIEKLELLKSKLMQDYFG